MIFIASFQNKDFAEIITFTPFNFLNQPSIKTFNQQIKNTKISSKYV